MKVVSGNEVTRIYPFIQADGEPGLSSDYIVIYPDKTIRHVSPHRAVMSAESVRLLAKALEYAAGLAEAGREPEIKYYKIIGKYTKLVIGVTTDIPGVLEEEPGATFEEVTREQFERFGDEGLVE